MNGKGQMGNLLATFFVLILLFIIMGFFVFMATGAALINKPSPPEASFDSYERDFLLQKVKVSDEIGFVLLLDAFSMYDQNIIEKQNFNNILRGFISEGNCIAMSRKILTEANEYVFTDDFYLEQRGGEIRDIYSGDPASYIRMYRDNHKMNSIKLNDEGTFVKYLEFYSGRCI